MPKVQIIPAILATTEEEYKDKIENLWESNLFDRDWVQIDLMDGEFVANKSVLPEIVKKYQASFKYELHLMVSNPYFWSTQFEDFHKTIRFIVPIETEQYELEEFIGFVRAFTDAEIGFSFNPETPLSKLGKYQEVAESLLIMSVHPGASGQQFVVGSLDKVEEAARLIKGNQLDCLLGVDGGIGPENAKLVIDAGADYLVVGSHLTNGDVKENFQKLYQQLQ